MSAVETVVVNLRKAHPKQRLFIESPAKRKVVCAGRRAGKTVGAAMLAVEAFLKGKRVLYTAPTTDQLECFWREVVETLAQPIAVGLFEKNETLHSIVLPRSDRKIRAKTAWNADTLRGDYADVLIFDEWQLMNEDAWDHVGAPMLLDNNGDAVFIYTPPSLHSRSVSKANDPLHASRLFKRAQADTSGRWHAIHFTSYDNPHISKEALRDITKDMTQLAFRQEILAEDIEEAPGALWKRSDISYADTTPELSRIVVGVDPSATSVGDEAGIIVAGMAGGKAYVLADYSMQASPLSWAAKAVEAFHAYKADRIVAEANQGGEMVAQIIAQVDPSVPVRLVYASRGKQTRAEPIAAQYEQGRVYHCLGLERLEDEMCLWVPGDPSPNRMDALVWALTDLMLGPAPPGIVFF